MVRFWCGQCNEEHDNARDCPAWQALQGLGKGPNLKQLKDHARRQRKADYRAPKGSKNAVEDSCALMLLALGGSAALVIWGAAEALAAVIR